MATNVAVIINTFRFNLKIKIKIIIQKSLGEEFANFLFIGIACRHFFIEIDLNE